MNTGTRLEVVRSEWQDGELFRFSRSRADPGFPGDVVRSCRVKIPHFVELQKQYGDKGLTVIGISLDEQGPEVVKKFVKQLGVNYPIVIGNEKVAEAYGGTDGISTTFVIDRRGQIVSQHIGYDDKATFEKEVESLL